MTMAIPAASDYAGPEAANDEPQGSTLPQLLKIMAMPNIAAELQRQKDLPHDITLDAISQRVMREFKIDYDSCEMWRERIKAALDLAMLVAEEKDYPFEGASNVKYPMLTTAALQFNARAYAAIVQGNRVVKGSVWGNDPDGSKTKRSERISEYMSYQLFQMPEWEEDTDRMLLQIPILGAMIRKVWFDPSLRRNVTRLITPDRMVVNYHARSMEDAPRKTEIMYLYPYEIEERIRDGRFIEFDYAVGSTSMGADDDDEAPDPDDGDAPQKFLEQHRLLDLDGDGYPEPYIVTQHYATEKICRIVANFSQDTILLDQQGMVTSIRPEAYYVKYQFLPSPDGGFYGWGFGWLLKDTTEAINTTINELLDAGHMNNIQGGFFSSALGIREKSMHFERGEFRLLNTSGQDIRTAIYPMEFKEPSQVLFNLLGTLIESGKEVASIKDVLTGDTQATAPVGTTLALIEQGLQVFTSIFKRVYRSLKQELEIHARLNRDNLTAEEYNDLVGDGQQMYDPKTDFDMSGRGVGIVPVADPGTATRMQKLAKAQATLDVADKYADVVGPAGRREAVHRFYEAMDEEDIDKLLPDPPAPDPEEEIIKRSAAELALQDAEATIAGKKTEALLDVAQAGALLQQNDLQRDELTLAAIQTDIEGKAGGVDTGGAATVAVGSGNGGGNTPPVGDGGANAANVAAIPVAPSIQPQPGGSAP